MIIDAHGHITWMGEEYDLFISTDECLRKMDRCGIDICCSSNPRYILEDWGKGNRKLAEAVREHPDRIIGFACFNPYFTDDVAEEMKRCVEEYGFRGVKLHYSQTWLYYDHPAYDPIYEAASEYGLPILVHGSDGAKSLIAPSKRFPGLAFLAGHAGGVLWQDAIKVAREHPNIYLEINYSVIDKGMIEQMVAGCGAEKVIFGTDMPFSDPSTSTAKVKYADITEEEKELLYFRNMANLLNMDI